MLRERQRELGNPAKFEQAAVLPEERRTFEENAIMYNRLPHEEQGVLRKQAGERIREETEAAYKQSGLNLNADQREVFALRFRQERRRLERQIQARANRQRARRVPQIIEELKREFGLLNEGSRPPKTEASPGENLPPPGATVPDPNSPKTAPSASPGAVN